MPRYEVTGIYQGRRIKPTIVQADSKVEALRKAEAKGVDVEDVVDLDGFEVELEDSFPPSILKKHHGLMSAFFYKLVYLALRYTPTILFYVCFAALSLGALVSKTPFTTYLGLIAGLVFFYLVFIFIYAIVSVMLKRLIIPQELRERFDWEWEQKEELRKLARKYR